MNSRKTAYVKITGVESSHSFRVVGEGRVAGLGFGLRGLTIQVRFRVYSIDIQPLDILMAIIWMAFGP